MYKLNTNSFTLVAVEFVLVADDAHAYDGSQ